ncbi:MAG: histidine phosphatase family protein [Parcubacteria group bacterium]|nr:histidine phosphatase family protein [Parcubacteria group bacterium]
MEPKVLKRIYFIRHGQTEGNLSEKSQLPEAPLSEEGRRQAEYVAERFSRIHADAVIASPYLRTKETAEPLAKILGKEIRCADVFRELRRPSEISGMNFHSPEYHRVIKEIEKGELDPNFRYSDEETLFELEARARQALDFLIAKPETDIVLVTHEVFLKMMFAAMMTLDTLSTIILFRELRYFVEIQNTDISIVEYGEESRGGLRWRLRVLNDRAHLG